MPGVCILAPAIVAGWPAISAAVAGAAAALGISVVQEGVEGAAQTVSARVQRVELTVEDCEVVGQSLATEEQAVLAKGDVRLRVFRDARGHCKVSVEGRGHSREELRAMGDEFVQRLTQMYVYNRVMTELKKRGFTVISEEVAGDESVHIHVRQHVC